MSAALVTTDWLSFATAASSGTGTAWTDPDGARLPLGDGATLTLRLLGTSQFLDLTGVTIPGAVPAAAHLVGIEVSIERAASASGVIDEDLRLLTAGLPLGENKAAGGAYPESFAPQITGGPADPWGTSLTRAELDASFGLRIRARNTSLKSSPMAALRAARIRLSFAEPDPGPIGQTQAGLALLEVSARLAAQVLRRAAPLPGHAACHAGADLSSVATRVVQGAAGWKVLGRLQRRRVRPCPCLRRSQLRPVSRLPPAALAQGAAGLESAGAVAADAGKAVSLSAQITAAAGLALTSSRVAQGAAGLESAGAVAAEAGKAVSLSAQITAVAGLALTSSRVAQGAAGLESAGAVAAEAGKAVSLSAQITAAAGLALTPSRVAQGAAGLHGGAVWRPAAARGPGRGSIGWRRPAWPQCGGFTAAVYNKAPSHSCAHRQGSHLLARQRSRQRQSMLKLHSPAQPRWRAGPFSQQRQRGASGPRPIRKLRPPSPRRPCVCALPPLCSQGPASGHGSLHAYPKARPRLPALVPLQPAHAISGSCTCCAQAPAPCWPARSRSPPHRSL
jgi:hypothetical protein